MARSTRSGDLLLPGEAGGLPRARWWRVVVATVVCSAVGAAWALTRPATYRAECIVQYEQEPSASPRGDVISSELGTREWFGTQDFLLASNSVAQGVVQQLKLFNDRNFFGVGSRDRFTGTPADAVERLREHMTVEHVADTRLVRIGVHDVSAKRAAAIANAVADTYLQKALESRVAAQQRAMSWLAEQIESTSQRLQNSESELQAYLEKRDAPALPVEQQQEMLATEIKQFNQILTDARVRRIELAARLAKLRAAHGANPFEVHAAEFDENEQVKQLQAQYQSTVLKYRELAAQSTAGLAVAAEQSKLQLLTEQLRAVIAGILKSAQGELSAAQSVENQLQTSLDKTSAAARELLSQQLKHGRLDRERSEAAELLKTLRDRSTAIGVASAGGTTNGRVLEAATQPAKPTPPPLARGMGLGAVCGLLLAAGLKRIGL